MLLTKVENFYWPQYDPKRRASGTKYLGKRLALR